VSHVVSVTVRHGVQHLRTCTREVSRQRRCTVQYQLLRLVFLYMLQTWFLQVSRYNNVVQQYKNVGQFKKNFKNAM
jgi:hypothetical protein